MKAATRYYADKADRNGFYRILPGGEPEYWMDDGNGWEPSETFSSKRELIQNGYWEITRGQAKRRFPLAIKGAGK